MRRFRFRFRFRLKTALLAVLLVAVGLWAEGFRRRSAFCRAAAVRNGREAAHYAMMADAAVRSLGQHYGPGELDLFRRLERHYASMARRYRAAAYRPWVAVPDEPATVGGWVNTAPRWRGP